MVCKYNNPSLAGMLSTFTKFVVKKCSLKRCCIFQKRGLTLKSRVDSRNNQITFRDDLLQVAIYHASALCMTHGTVAVHLSRAFQYFALTCDSCWRVKYLILNLIHNSDRDANKILRVYLSLLNERTKNCFFLRCRFLEII